MKMLILALLALALFAGCGVPPEPSVPAEQGEEHISLPEARLTGEMTVEEALFQRRSVRDYTGEPLSLEEVSQLLWAAQGITVDWGGRTAPSAGGTYPLKLYLVAGEVDGLDAGIYLYHPGRHELAKILSGDVRKELAESSLGQSSVEDGAVVLVISAVYERTTGRYGGRGLRYVHMEAGHAAQNVYLQATALDLGCVVVGAFQDDELGALLGLPEDEAPLYVIPVGRISTGS